MGACPEPHHDGVNRDARTLPSPADVVSNLGVLRYLAGGGPPESVAAELPTDHTDTWRLGAHPDIVEWLWTTLNGALPADARCLLDNGAALVHRTSGVILAVALGTRYALRLTEPDLDQALARGYATAHDFRTVGRHLDLASTFGPGWVIGAQEADEARWLRASWSEADR